MGQELSRIRVGHGPTFQVDPKARRHECNDAGDVVYFTKSGKTVRWFTIRKWAHLTTQAREPLLYAHYDERDDPILAASATCSICHSVAMYRTLWLPGE